DGRRRLLQPDERHVGQHDARARVRQRDRGGAPDPARRAGDDGNLAVQTKLPSPVAHRRLPFVLAVIVVTGEPLSPPERVSTPRGAGGVPWIDLVTAVVARTRWSP